MSPKNKRPASTKLGANANVNANTMDHGPCCSEPSNGILIAIQSLREDLLNKIDENAKTQSLELKQHISQLRDELRGSIDKVSSRTKALEATVESLESACSRYSDVIARLEQDIEKLSKALKLVADKNEDLEARSRRCNLRITGITEGRESGKAALPFMAGLLKETLGLDSFPTLDRSHRALRTRPDDDQPPRAFVIKCHYFQEKEAILRAASKKKGLVTSAGDTISIFPDYTQAVAKQRAAFRDAKKILRNCAGVEYRLNYPAVLHVVTKVDGLQYRFDDPSQAKDFALGLTGATHPV